ncbi:MAG: GNAT family N-acetyltransferase [Cyclobacteriaceae bacterium]
MEVQHKETDSKGSFYIGNGAEILAEMTYSKAGTQLIIIDHTEVHESRKGQGVGLRLLTTLVDHARTKRIKVMPLCPFAKSVFEKKSELRDVLN